LNSYPSNLFITPFLTLKAVQNYDSKEHSTL
jgi:hypothetical protein